MYAFDFSTLYSTLNSFFHVVGGILRFDEAALDAIFTQNGGDWMAIAIMILGGISIAVGQSVVLFANRVSQRRFIFSLISSGVVFVLWIVLWAGSTWLLVRVFLDAPPSFATILLSAAVSMAPLFFGFLVLLPYIGNIIFQLLRVWILLIFLFVISTGTAINYLSALIFTGSGWLLIELVLRFPPLQFERLRNRGWQLVTGRPHRLETDEVAQQFIAEVHAQRNLDRKGDAL